MSDFFSGARIKSGVFTSGESLQEIKNNILKNIRKNGLKDYGKLYRLLDDYCNNCSVFSDLKKLWNLSKEISQNDPWKSISNLFRNFINEKGKKRWGGGTFLSKILLEWNKFLKNTPGNRIDNLSIEICNYCGISLSPDKPDSWKEAANLYEINDPYDSLVVTVGEVLKLPSTDDTYVKHLCEITKLWKKMRELKVRNLKT